MKFLSRIGHVAREPNLELSLYSRKLIFGVLILEFIDNLFNSLLTQGLAGIQAVDVPGIENVSIWLPSQSLFFFLSVFLPKLQIVETTIIWPCRLM